MGVLLNIILKLRIYIEVEYIYSIYTQKKFSKPPLGGHAPSALNALICSCLLRKSVGSL